MEWRPGLVVAGLYEIGEQLESGPAVVVHRVRHLEWDQDMAVSSPRPELWADAESMAAFLDAAQAWVQLPPHPHICTCYYIRVLDGLPRIFAEYAPGDDLTHALQAGRCSTMAEILDVAIQLAWGLGAVHRCGVVHQDVTPADVVLTAEGTAKITGFGRSRALAQVSVPPGDAGWSWAMSVLELFTGEVGRRPGSVAGQAVALLRECFAANPADRPAGMGVVAERLIGTYEVELGRPYPRAAGQPTDQLADRLNNKALSLLELGQPENAERCWEQALTADPRHPDATFNRGMLRWRSARITDLELIGQLDAVCVAHTGIDVAQRRVEDLLGLVNAERGTTQPVTLTGHTHQVWAVAVATDGRHALSGDGDGMIRLWDLTSGDCLRTLSGHTKDIRSVAITPDARYAVSGSSDRSVRWWDLSTGRCLRSLDGSGGAVAAITSDGRYALSGNVDGVVHWWDLRAGRCLRILTGHADSVCAVAVTPDGRHGLSGSFDNTLRWWDLASDRCLRTLTGHTGAVCAVAVTPDGRRALSGSFDNTLRWWDLASGHCLRTLADHGHRVLSVAVTDDGRHAVSGSLDRTMRWWDLNSGRCLRTFAHSFLVLSVAVTPDGRHALSGSGDHTLRWWRLDRGRDAPWSYSRPQPAGDLGSQAGEFRMRTDQARRLLERDDVESAAVALRQARNIPGFAGHPVLLDLWHRAGRGRRRTAFRDIRQTRTLTGHAGITSVAITPDGRHGLSGGWDDTVRWWDLDTGGCLRVLAGHRGVVCSVAITPDARYALSGGQDGTVRWWDLDTGDCLHTLAGHTDSVTSVAITPDARHSLSGGQDGTVRWWDLDTGRCLHTLAGHTDSVTSVAITPDARHALSGSADETQRWWDLSSGRCLRTLSGHCHGISSVAVTPDGRRALSGQGCESMQLWDLTSGHSLRTLIGGPHPVTSVAITRDARHALSGSQDGTMRWWDLGTGRCLRTLTDHADEISSVAVTPDARHALSGSRDCTMRLWTFDWDYEFPEHSRELPGH